MTTEDIQKEFERQYALGKFSDEFFYKDEPTDKIWWVETPDKEGEFLFTFDKKTVFNFFRDYPEKLTEEQIKIFQKENPALAELKPTKND